MPIHRLAADYVVHNARVRSLDDNDTSGDAVAIAGSRIIGVGSGHDFDSVVDSATQYYDACGRTVMPSFTDGHTHFQKAALTRYQFIDYHHEGAATIEQVVDAVRRRAEQTPDGEWIRAEGLYEPQIAEHRLPTRHELDAAAPNNPVMIITMGNHSIAASSAALQAAGITRDTPQPSGGRIELDGNGEPSGVLRETAKLRLDNNHPDNVIPRQSVEQRVRPLVQMINDVHQYGITGIHDMMVEGNEIASWIHLRREEQLNMRVQMLIRGIETRTPLEYVVGLGLQHGLGDEWLRMGGVKFSVDGICAHKLAAVYDGYPGEPDNHGLIRIPKEELDAGIIASHRAGIRVAVHCVGQVATDMALDAFEEAFEGRPAPHMRHRMEHIHLPPNPGQLERMAKLGLVASIQPGFLRLVGDSWQEIWGEVNPGLRGFMSLRSMKEAGLRLIGGTDFGGGEINPFMVMKSAVMRRSLSGYDVDVDQALTLDEAIRLETVDSAWGGFEEKIKGTLEPGKLADLIVLSDDPWTVGAEHLDDIDVDLTMVGGEVVYERHPN